MDKDYYIGLDVGSDSVGWAVTDENFDLLRIKGKTAWGGRIFDGGETAKKRRLFRTSGRRLARRKFRITLLNKIFAEEINKIDDTFFLRLEQSSYHLEDKSLDNQYLYPLFKNKEDEKKFYKQYPTIWHLRRALLRNEKDAYSDIRYVYLAIHHIIKYRGNFLKEGEINTSNINLDDEFNKLNERMLSIVSQSQGEDDVEELDFSYLCKENYNKFVEILENKDLNKNTKQDSLNKLISTDELGKGNVKFSKLFIQLVTGGSYDLKNIDETVGKKSIQFDSSFDENEGEFHSILGENYELVGIAKNIFDAIYVKELLDGCDSLSDSFVNTYENHKIDLRELKKLFIEYDNAKDLKKKDRLYYQVFVDCGKKEKKDKDDKKKKSYEINYPAFIHDPKAIAKRPKVHEFCVFIKGKLEEIEPYITKKEEYKRLLKLADEDKLLLAVSNISNSAIPHQLHLNELKIILQNAMRMYPFLKEEYKKIEAIFKFRVPYYYGPLDDRSKWSKVERNTKETIYPWNIDKVINDAKTRDNFMKSLTNKCTYLFVENVLPKHSILFQDFVILNRLNSTRINGALIEQNVKLDLFNNYITKRKKTSVAGIKRYLEDHYEVYKKDGAVISGLNVNDEFVSSSRETLSNLFNLADKNELEKAEKVIHALTIWTDSMNDAIEYIKKEIPITPEQEKVIRNMRCSGWATLSRKFLNGIRFVDEIGEVHETIYQLLLDRVMTLQEIINSPSYKFDERIRQCNAESSGYGELSSKQKVEKHIEKTSPMNRRSVIQAMRIVEEIAKILKKDPKKIVIEVTRENTKNKGKETNSRYKEVKQFIDSLKHDADAFIKEHANNCSEELKQRIEEQKNKLNSKFVYLYFKQLGLDMYTGEAIDLNEVLNGSNKYDIDHIIPQSKIKNDSLDNLVLTNKHTNEMVKGDKYPVPDSIKNNPRVRSIWKLLKDKNQISSDKYNNLIRSTDLTDEEIQGFIERQINVVNQSNKVLKDIFNELYPNTRLIFSKAQYPSYLRKEYDIPKFRALNDTHHAVDAYLNIICGTVLDDKYGDIRAIKARKSMNVGDKNYISYNMEHTLDKKMKEEGFKDKVLKTTQRHDFLLTYRNTYQDNAFYGGTICKKGLSDSLIAVHTAKDNPLHQTEKYGGYSDVVSEYFVCANVIGKNDKTNRILVTVPTMIVKNCSSDDEIARELTKQLGLTKDDVTIDLSRKIYPSQKILYCGNQYLLCVSDKKVVNLKPVTPIYLKDDFVKYLSILEKKKNDLKNYLENEYVFYTDRARENQYVISKDKNVALYKEIVRNASAKRYNACPMISDLPIKLEEDLEEFLDLNLEKQVDFLIKAIQIFGRNSLNAKIGKNLFRLSKKIFFKSNNCYLINESITGLYKKVVKF